MMHGGWMRQLTVDDTEKPRMSWRLLRRVLSYARPYRRKMSVMLVIIVITSGLSLVTPLIMRDLIDRTLPTRDMGRLGLLMLGLLLIPIASAALSL
jgi:ATP-binding cassette subfamily B protein